MADRDDVSLAARPRFTDEHWQGAPESRDRCAGMEKVLERHP